MQEISPQPSNTYSTVTFAIPGTFSAFYFADNNSIDLVFMLSMIRGVPTRWSGHMAGQCAVAAGILTGLQPYATELMLLVRMLGSMVLRMLFKQSWWTGQCVTCNHSAYGTQMGFHQRLRDGPG